jgi:outer membrane receptor for ferrienterochelin and colicin
MLSAAAYLNHTDDKIQFTQVEPDRFTYLNFDRVTDAGVELGIDGPVGQDMTAFANYTWQAEPKATGFDKAELNRPPAHRINVGVSFDRPRSRYFGSASASYQTEAYWQDVTRYEGTTAPYTLVNAGAGIRSPDGGITVAVRATNLLNHTIQQHTFGDVIKRTVIGEVRLAF